MTGTPLRLELRGSPTLTTLTIIVHAAAALSLFAALPPVAGLFAVAATAVLGYFAVREITSLTSPRAPAALHLGHDGALTVSLRDGAEEAATVSARRYVSRFIVVLGLEAPHRGRRTILVARDMLAPEAFRQLRLWTLWNRLPTPFAAARSRAERTISADTCL